MKPEAIVKEWYSVCVGALVADVAALVQIISVSRLDLWLHIAAYLLSIGIPMLVVAVITYERIRYKEHEIHEIMEDWGRIDWPYLVGTTATVGAFFFIFSHISYWCGGLFGIAGIVGMGVLNRQSTRMLQKLRQGA